MQECPQKQENPHYRKSARDRDSITSLVQLQRGIEVNRKMIAHPLTCYEHEKQDPLRMMESYFPKIPNVSMTTGTNILGFRFEYFSDFLLFFFFSAWTAPIPASCDATQL